MAKIRIVKTGSGARAVQAVSYRNNQRKILKHFGSAKTDLELDEIIAEAEEWVKDYSGQLSLFVDDNPNLILHINKCSFLGIYYSFFREQITYLQEQFGYFSSFHSLLNDLVMMRIFEPSSKLRSIELLSDYFGLQRNRQTYYRLAPNWLKLKTEVELKTVAFAKQQYNFECDIVFYDVTTLYFESFTEDELKKNGFSKDGKSQQPQILVALIVTKEGFPVSYEIFTGNIFEGNTFIPVIKQFIEKNKVTKMIVVADAAMISAKNIKELIEYKINYIVGARLANLGKDTVELIDKTLTRIDGESIRLQTDNGFLVCTYSQKRYNKDKFEMEKQIKKAEEIIKQPSKAKKVKYTKTTTDNKLELNKDLQKRNIKLLGIKGYITDIAEKTLSNNEITEKYHELYKVEHAFRMSKNDLEARPIFHTKSEPIQLHILICFMALSIARHIELRSGVSIKKFITESKKISDARMLNLITNKEIKIRAKITPTMSDILTKINSPH